MKNLGRTAKLGFFLGYQDIYQGYRRSIVGQFWITLGMATQIITISLVFGILFRIPSKDYLPYVATGIIVWNLISGSILESTRSYIESEQLIKQLPVDFLTYNVRTISRNLLVFFHNSLILPITMLFLGILPSMETLLLLPGLALLLANLCWISVILGVAATRFRDLIQVAASLMMVLFYVTPVMWKIETLGDSISGHYLLGLNPLYHLLQIVRLPLLGKLPTQENWLISLVLLLLGTLAARSIYRLNKDKLAYWV